MGLIDVAPGLPPRHVERIRAFWSARNLHESVHDEIAVLRSRTEPQVRRAGDLGDMPLMVLTADGRPNDWNGLQNELASLSTDSVHEVIDGSTHLSLAFDKEDAKQTSAAIMEVVEAARTNKPLTREG